MGWVNGHEGLRYPRLMDGPVPMEPGAGAIDDDAVGPAAAGRDRGPA